MKVPPEWQINSLVLGSAHINNVVASSKRGTTRRLLQRLLDEADACKCDAIGVDLNQGIDQLREQFQLWILRTGAEVVPTTLLGNEPGDCCGFLLPPCSQLHKAATLQRHGVMPWHHRDLQIRSYDHDSHFPGFMVHACSAKRTRADNLSEARLARKERKKAKLQIGVAAKKSGAVSWKGRASVETIRAPSRK